MAEFNPQQGEKDPKSYLGYSGGTDRAAIANIPNTSGVRQIDFGYTKSTPTGELLPAVAKLAVTGVDAVNTIVKDIAAEQVRSGVESIRTNFTKNVSDSLSGATPVDKQGFGVIETNPDEENIPTDVANVGRRAQQLTSAKEAGKLTEVGYWLQLDNFAKSMRERYPFHKDYIDRKISEYSGTNPANALWRSQLSALTLMAQQGQAKATSDERWLQQNAKYLNPSTVQKLYTEDQPNIVELKREVALNQNTEHQLQLQGQMYTLKSQENTATKQDADKYALTVATTHGNNLITNVLNSPAGLRVRQVLESKDPASITQKDKEEAIASWEAISNSAQSELNKLMDSGMHLKPGEGATGPELVRTGNTFRATLGQEDTKKAIEAGMSQFKIVQDQLYKGDFSIFKRVKEFNDAQQDSRVASMVSNFPIFGAVQAINKLGGPTALQTFFSSQGKEGETAFGNFVKASNLIAMGEIAKGNFTNFKDEAAFYRANGFKPDTDPQVFRGGIDNKINQILDKNADPYTKAVLASNLFDPVSSLEYAKMPLETQKAIYDKVTTPEFRESMIQLRQSNQGLWIKYKQFTVDKFLPLNRGSMGAVQTNNENNRYVTIGYSAKDNQLVPLPKTLEQQQASKELLNNVPGTAVYRDGSRITGVEASVIDEITKINQNLRNLVPIIAVDTPSGIAYVIQSLFKAGGLNLVKPPKEDTNAK